MLLTYALDYIEERILSTSLHIVERYPLRNVCHAVCIRLRFKITGIMWIDHRGKNCNRRGHYYR